MERCHHCLVIQKQDGGQNMITTHTSTKPKMHNIFFVNPLPTNIHLPPTRPPFTASPHPFTNQTQRASPNPSFHRSSLLASPYSHHLSKLPSKQGHAHSTKHQTNNRSPHIQRLASIHRDNSGSRRRSCRVKSSSASCLAPQTRESKTKLPAIQTKRGKEAQSQDKKGEGGVQGRNSNPSRVSKAKKRKKATWTYTTTWASA